MFTFQSGATSAVPGRDGSGSAASEKPAPQLQPSISLTRMRHPSLFKMIPHRPPTVATSAASIITRVFYKTTQMIEGPCSGAISDADSASAADVTALTGAVATNTAAISLKAAAADLATAEGTLTTHTGQIASLNNSYNTLGDSFYTKVFTDALLSGRQAVQAMEI